MYCVMWIIWRDQALSSLHALIFEYVLFNVWSKKMLDDFLLWLWKWKK